MTDPNLTRASLIFRLKDHDDHDAWKQFLDLYGQTIFQFVRSRGLQDADAADLMQEVFKRVGNAIGRLEYAKQKGGFRAWLFTITRNCLNSYFKKKQNGISAIGGSSPQIALGQISDEKDELNERWEREFQKQIMLQAIEVVRPTSAPNTWAAFEMTAIQNLSMDEVVKSLGMTRGAIYVARSRVTSRLKSEVERLLEQEA
ncbi:sigma-70 family RNA polymerase sigma factor [Mariniblastus sp.]|nr:sigma-70 family RNA polymerase sigma factor [Mariniblastus sp.]